MFMRNFANIAALALAVALTSIAARAQTPPPPTPKPQKIAPQKPLDALAWLDGGTWTAQEKSLTGAATLELTFHFEENRQAIVWEVVHRGSDGKAVPQYEGFCAWHPAKQTLAVWQVDRSGDVGEGELTVENEVISQVVHVSIAGGGTQDLRTIWQRVDDNTLHAQGQFRMNEHDGWKQSLDLVFHRSPKR